MKRLLRDIIISIGALASFVGVVLATRRPEQPWTVFQIALFVTSGLLTIIAIWVDVNDFRERPVKYFKGHEAIRRYMYHWISNASSVAIFSRDLSWVSTDEMRNLLRQKARDGELHLFLPEEIRISEELQALGAEVYYYGNIDYVIRSRFTMININRNDTRVAIGRAQDGKHRVEEFSELTDPAFNLSQDLLEIVKRYSRRPDRV
ncbi:hypothetical protein [Kribbella sp. CA-247076]|uniref:hypothetical protein n=1 Tax=Kribbella sp. CA-247076 TaxID=3239941 RepID=UPI003D8EAC13